MNLILFMIYVNSGKTRKTFLELYDKYYDKIYSYIFKNVSNREFAEDITSNTFFKALNHIQKKNPNIKKFSSWLYKIATNELLMHVRYKGHSLDVSIEDDENNLHEVLENEDINIDQYAEFLELKQKMGFLKSEEQNLINMHFFENLDYKEIADILDIKVTTIRSKIHRTLNKLKKYYEE